MKKFIGFYRRCDFITMLGTTFAISGIILAMKEYYIYAVCALILSGICDLFDGKVARKYNYNEDAKVYGVQLDSLSDSLAFGLMPAYITISISNNIFSYVIAIIYILCGIIRLAYFNMLNITKRAKEGVFRGVPITTIAIVYPLIFLIFYFVNSSLLKIVLPLILLIMAFSFILNVEVPKIDFLKIFSNHK